MKTPMSACVVAVFAAGIGPAPVQADVVAFDWTVAPTSFTSVDTVPIGPGLLTVMRSGYTGGVYQVDLDLDGLADGSLTASVELISRVVFDGLSYSYSWELSNLGSGALTDFLGANAPEFLITATAPLYGTAGPDRIVGTSDDLATQTLSSSLVSMVQPGSQAWGIINNPSTDLSASLLAPNAVPEPMSLALALAGLAALGVTARRRNVAASLVHRRAS